MSSDKQYNTSIKSLLTSNIRNYSMAMMLALIMIIFAFLTEWR